MHAITSVRTWDVHTTHAGPWARSPWSVVTVRATAIGISLVAAQIRSTDPSAIRVDVREAVR